MDGERSFFMTVLVVFGDLSLLFKVSVIASEAWQSAGRCPHLTQTARCARILKLLNG